MPGFSRACRGRLLGGPLALLTAATLAAQAPAAEKIVPVHEESHHRQLFQHGAVRILDMQIAPGDGSAFHRHDWPVLLLGLTTSRTRRQNLGEEWSAEAAAPATPVPASRSIRPTSTTTYADKPLTHRLENIIKDLRDLARLEGGGIALHPERLSVSGLFERIA